jgi:hypothetical protein
MPHQQTDSSKAPAQNAATQPQAPNDMGREQNRALRPEPRNYAARDVADASLAAPAAGEIGDYADEGEATGYDGQQQGANHTNRPHRTEAQRTQGRLTREYAKRAINRQ